MEFDNILVEKRNGAGWITLNRPQMMNALSSALVQDTQAALKAFEEDDEVRVIVITGAGPNFSAGGDLAEQKENNKDILKLARWLQGISDFFDDLYHCKKPTVAMVRGFALAGGLELILLCDMAIVAEDAKIGDQHINYGLMGCICSVPMLARALNIKKAKEILLTGCLLTGKEAEQLGLVNAAVSPGKLEEETEKFLKQMTDKSRLILSETKKLVNKSLELSLDQSKELGLLTMMNVVQSSEDVAEGWAAFEEKRKPVWK